MTKTIYFDESGWTGYDFLNPDQPVFVISSTDIQEDTAEGLLRQAFPNYQGIEFKFGNIWRSPRNRQGLVRLVELLPPFAGHIFSWVTMKRFATLTKMVDFLLEPLVTFRGYDFYAEGYCWKYTNLVHFDLTNHCPPESYDALLRGYQAFSRRPSRETLDDLKNLLARLDTGGAHKVETIFHNFALGLENFERFHRLDDFHGSDEIHLSTMLASIAWWRTSFDEDFMIIHDASANFFRRRRTWDRISNDGQAPEIQVGGDGQGVEFPLRVLSTEQVDSRASYSVQLCDMIAGLVARHYNPSLPQADRTFLDGLIERGLGGLDWNGIRPGHTFPTPNLPRRRQGPDLIDQLARRLYAEGFEDIQ